MQSLCSFRPWTRCYKALCFLLVAAIAVQLGLFAEQAEGLHREFSCLLILRLSRMTPGEQTLVDKGCRMRGPYLGALYQELPRLPRSCRPHREQVAPGCPLGSRSNAFSNLRTRVAVRLLNWGETQRGYLTSTIHGSRPHARSSTTCANGMHRYFHVRQGASTACRGTISAIPLPW